MGTDVCFLFFLVIDRIFFKWPKKIKSARSRVRKYRLLVNTVTTSINIVLEQTTEMSERRKTAHWYKPFALLYTEVCHREVCNLNDRPQAVIVAFQTW